MSDALRRLTRTLVFEWSIYTPLLLLWIPVQALGHRRALRQLPGVAAQLGLARLPGSAEPRFGGLGGDILGRSTLVEPEDEARISALFQTRKTLELHESPRGTHPPQGMIEFETPNSAFNRMFRTRRAAKETADTLCSTPDLLADIVRFSDRWLWSLRYLAVEGSRVSCSLRYGHPWSRYVPPRVLEGLLPELVALTDHIETTIGCDGPAVKLERYGLRSTQEPSNND